MFSLQLPTVKSVPAFGFQNSHLKVSLLILLGLWCGDGRLPVGWEVQDWLQTNDLFSG